MVMDPVTLALLSAVGGATAKKFIDEAWDLGKGWLDDYFLKHQPKAKEKAQENALDFLIDLGKRIQKLEEDTENSEIIKEQIKNSLSDPDFSALLQNALIASARTSSKEKHILLANIVSDRLTAGQESLKALVCSMAVDVIPYISSKHLKILGIMTVILWQIVPVNQETMDPNSWRDYLVDQLSPLIPEEEIKYVDYLHLLSVSCINMSIGSKDIQKLISPTDMISGEWDSDIFLKETDVGQKINEIWSQNLKHMNLTSIGGIIGVYVINEVFGSKTDLSKLFGTY